MSDEIRSNAQEFLSFLGTCMTFYNMHLTPYEQDHIMAEMGKIIHDHLAPKNYSKLMKYAYGEKNPAYMDTDSVNAVREAYHTGQTHAVMRGGETNVNDQI